MSRKALFTAAAAVVIACVAVKVSAQSNNSSANRRLSILQRLERLGRSLVDGDSRRHTHTHDAHRHTHQPDGHLIPAHQRSHSDQVPQLAAPFRRGQTQSRSATTANERRSSRRTFQPDYRLPEDPLASEYDDEDALTIVAPDASNPDGPATDPTGEESSFIESVSPPIDDGATPGERGFRTQSAARPSRAGSPDVSALLNRQPESLQERLAAARSLRQRSARSTASRIEREARSGGVPSDTFGHASGNVATPATSRSHASTTAPHRVPSAPSGFSRYETSRTAPATGRSARDAGHAADDAVLFIRRSPSLGVETSGPRQIKIGQKASYTVVIYNRGEIDAHDVVVTIDIPAWTQVAGTEPTVGAAHTSSGSAERQLVEWLLEELEGGGREELELSLVPTKSRPFDLGVRWTHSPLASQAMVEVQEPKLQLALSGPDEVNYGQEAVYKLTISNPGTGDAEHVAVRLLSTAPGETETASYTVGTISAGNAEVVELELTAQQAGLLVIKAEATAEGGLTAQVHEEVLVRRGHLDVDIVGPHLQYAGTVATYKIRVSNPGNAVVNNVEVTAMMPTGAEFVSAHDGGKLAVEHGQVKWDLGSLGTGSEQILWLTCKLNAAGTNRPQVVAVGDGDLKDTALAATEVETLADLVLDVQDPRGPIRVGDEMTYELRIRNRGTKSAEMVQVTAFFSPGIEPASVEGAPHRIATGQVVFDPIATISAGGEMVLKIQAVALREGSHVFRAEVHCEALDLALAEEETTRFYDDRSDAHLAEEDPSPPAELEPEPAPIYEAKRPER